MKYSYAIIRKPGKNYVQAISSTDESKNIDLEKALFQHSAYAKVLTDIGLTVITLPADKNYPDGCFVQDPFVIFGKTALQTVLGADSRKGEGKALFEVIKHFKKIKTMQLPSTMDGGDVLVTPNAIFIGYSQRTNLTGIKMFAKVFEKEHIPPVIPVPVEKCLHLMTGASYIGKNTMLVTSAIDKKIFKEFTVIDVPEEEEYAANCMQFGNVVIMPKGYPFVKKQITNLGFAIIELEMTEFKKADGGLTCLSQLW